MNQRGVLNSVIRFGLLFLAQVFVLQQIGWGWGGEEYLLVFLTPLFVLLLPLRTPNSLAVLLGFALGLACDLFYETLGLQAAALTFAGYLRGPVLRIFEPRDGYGIKANPSRADLGLGWQLRVLAVLLLGFCLVFFCLQAFSYVYALDIVLRVLFSFPASYFLAVVVLLIFNPQA